jgi:predicted nucleic acid-binding protein
MIAIDTNLLVYAHRAAAAQHGLAIRALERAAGDARGWGFAIGSVVEFWHVVTHPSAAGRPSTPDEARRFVGNLARQGRARVWLPMPGLPDRLLDTAVRMGLTGGRVFDLQLALTALDNGATEMWTHDAAFVRVPGLVVVDPLA